jgi:cupin fold WbuC family metalloprotein
MKIIDNNLLDSLTEKARSNPRLRMNHNFHESLDDALNRLLNAMEPGTYVPPHRHLNPDKEEIFIVLRGSTLLLTFDNAGNINNAVKVSPLEGIHGMEIEAGVWHSLIVLEPATVVYEIKRGPYAPLAPENIAPWAFRLEEKDKIARYISGILDKYL